MNANLSQIMESVQGEGLLIGARQVFVRFTGCNLQCNYCDTTAARGNLLSCSIHGQPGIHTVTGIISNPVSTDDLARIIQSNFSARWISLTGGEPLLWTDYIIELSELLKPCGYRFLLETNGSLPGQLDKCLNHLDVISLDFKLPSATGLNLWTEHRLFLQKVMNKNCYIKVVITSSTQWQEIEQVVEIITSMAKDIPLVLQPATGNTACHSPNIQTALQMQHKCLESLDDVRIIPQMHTFLNLP